MAAKRNHYRRPADLPAPSARTPLPFKTSEIARAIRGVQNMGMGIGAILINTREGTIRITPTGRARRAP
jgi:hypothetical protein